MLIDIDNKGTVYFINNWIVGWIIRHVETGQFFLREIKEQVIFQVIWISGDDNEVDFFPGICLVTFFEKYCVNLNVEE